MEFPKRFHATQKPSVWDICKKVSLERSNFNFQICSHTEGKPFIKQNMNAACNKELQKVREVSKSLRTSKVKKRSFICKVCNEEFSQKCDFIRHRPIHKPSVWDVCKQEFTERSQLHTTLESDNKTEIKFSASDVCDEKYLPESCPLSHLHTHREEEAYICTTCNKSYASRHYLATHLHTHSRENAYICDICNKGFYGKAYLKIHSAVHAEVKPFQCEKCEKRFCLERSLKKHFKIHVNIPPLLCGACEKGFYSEYDLKMHIRTHTGEKPYVCIICDRRFLFKSSLMAHHLTHTGEKPYVCVVCNKAYSSRSGLRTHLRINHRGETPHI